MRVDHNRPWLKTTGGPSPPWSSTCSPSMVRVFTRDPPPPSQRALQRRAAEMLPSLQAMPGWVVGCDEDGFLPLAEAPAATEAHGGFSNGRHSALNGAARNGHAAIVALLLEKGAQVDAASATDTTALYCACHKAGP